MPTTITEDKVRSKVETDLRLMREILQKRGGWSDDFSATVSEQKQAAIARIKGDFTQDEQQTVATEVTRLFREFIANKGAA